MGVVGTRLRYGSLAVAIVVSVLWLDRGPLAYLASGLTLAALALAAQAEFYRMLRGAGQRPATLLGLSAGAYYLFTRLAPVLEWEFTHRTPLPDPQHTFDAGAHLAVAVIFLLVAGVLSRRTAEAPARIGATLVGLLLVPFLLGYLVEIRYLPDGWSWVVFLVAVAKAGDSTAFFVGRSWGRHKLIEEISPNKTWEGAIGSVGGSLLAAWVVVSCAFPASPPPWTWIPAALLVNVGAQFGDLGESLLKRGCRVKDSASLLPVMGGTFDLVDSFLIAAPVLRLFLSFSPAGVAG